MRLTPEKSAAGCSAEIPGAVNGRGPRARSEACSAAKEITATVCEPASSEIKTSETARPIQLSESSPVRFSNRRTANRSTAGVRVREQQTVATPSATRISTLRLWHTGFPLQNTRFHGEQFLEFGQLADRDEFRILHELLPLCESFFQRLADVEQRAIVHSCFGVRF